MNAFLRILEQLVTALEPAAWLRQRFYPFEKGPAGTIELFDACVFHQDANGAIGMAWLRCPGQTELMTFPFRIARYSEDGDLIVMPPWSLREATTDALFYSTWKQAVASSGNISTLRGGVLLCRQFEAQSSFNIINLWTDNKNACTRVETQHLCKIFRVLNPQQPHSVEAETLEYLNSQNHFLQHPEITTRYDFSPAYSDAKLPVAIVTRYIQSNTKLWRELTSKIHHARYPESMRERASSLAWQSILETVNRLGRMLGDFHVAMTQSRQNPLINPEANAGAARERWLETTRHKLNERIYIFRSLTDSIHGLDKSFAVLPEFALQLFDKVKTSEHLGLLIRIHGHVHLGQVLVAEDGLYLVNYETDSLDDEEYRLEKQTCLKDLAAMLLSLQFAWLRTERNEELPIFQEILGSENEFGKRLLKRIENVVKPARYKPSLAELENTLVRSYLLTIAENPTGVELLPEKAADVENLFELCLLMRVLKETIRDLQNQNPHYKIDLKILAEILEGRKAKPNFDSFFNAPARLPSTLPSDQSYGLEPEFS
ncbi:MAG: hypothetical protein FJY29_06780 [Betaproteobacteria bacterium]|nr:hypothetical protein [Betaproteobacteria bacterium]